MDNLSPWQPAMNLRLWTKANNFTSSTSLCEHWSTITCLYLLNSSTADRAWPSTMNKSLTKAITRQVTINITSVTQSFRSLLCSGFSNWKCKLCMRILERSFMILLRAHRSKTDMCSSWTREGLKSIKTSSWPIISTLDSSTRCK